MVLLFISRLSLRALHQQVCSSSVLQGLQTFLATEDAAKNQTNSAHCKPKECCQAPGTIRSYYNRSSTQLFVHGKGLSLVLV